MTNAAYAAFKAVTIYVFLIRVFFPFVDPCTSTLQSICIREGGSVGEGEWPGQTEASNF